MKKFEEPIVKVVTLKAMDVIATSGQVVKSAGESVTQSYTVDWK